MRFLNGLDSDLKTVLLAQLRNLWTHNSAALEGNTLTLAETAFVIEEGLTVSGKSLKDHQEVVGHASAIELIYEMVSQAAITEKDLFKLHKAIQTEHIADIYKPIGGWKLEQNGTYAIDENQKQIYLAYAKPEDVSALMKKWLSELNAYLNMSGSQQQAETKLISAYANLHLSFVRIHPFFDGNGRMARLLANLPLLKAGYPPITIQKESRQQYIKILSGYELAVGQPSAEAELLPSHKLLTEFNAFCKTSWQPSLDLVDEIKKIMEARTAPKSKY